MPLPPPRLASTCLALMLPIAAFAQGDDTVPVNAANFVRAETDTYLADGVARNGLGVLAHDRKLVSIDDQPVIRMNLDTLYSQGVYDLAAGPVTVTIPDQPDGRYVAVQVLSEDHLTPVVLHEGTHVLSEDMIGTRYLTLLVRTFVDPNDPEDLARAHDVQDSIVVSQEATGSFEIPNWDKATLDNTRQALLDLAALGMPETRRMGTKDEIDPIAHLIATAAGWGLNPESEAVYIGVNPAQNDGKTVYRLVMKDIPVDGFWSVSVYNAGGFFEKNDLNTYAVNNVTGKAEADGAVTIQFGGCDSNAPNCIPTTDGWNYLIRLYRPHPEILSGDWTAPDAKPVE